MLQCCCRTAWLTLGICFSFHPICFRLLLPFWLLHISQAVTRLSLQPLEGLETLWQADERPHLRLRFSAGTSQDTAAAHQAHAPPLEAGTTWSIVRSCLRLQYLQVRAGCQACWQQSTGDAGAIHAGMHWWDTAGPQA